MTKCTIDDYIKQVEALRDLGRKLVVDQYNNHDQAAMWADAVEEMDERLTWLLMDLWRASFDKEATR